MNKLAIVDFDGTIYKGDSMRDFARFINAGRYFFSLLVIAVPAIFATLGLIHRDRIKKTFLRINFRNKKRQWLNDQGKAFFEVHKNLLFSEAIEWINENRGSARIIILSGSCAEWLSPFCDHLDVELYCTQLKYDEKMQCTGEWKERNVTGKNKVMEVRERIPLQDYETIIAFGDQRSDECLKEIATEFHLDYFRG